MLLAGAEEIKKTAAAMILAGVVLAGCNSDTSASPSSFETPSKNDVSEVTPSLSQQSPTNSSKRTWKTNGEINYSLVSFQRKPEYETSDFAKQVRTIIENSGFHVDRVWAFTNEVDGERLAGVLVGIKDRQVVTTQEALQLYGKLNKEIKTSGIRKLSLTIAWWNKEDKNTYTIQMYENPNGEIDVISYYTGE